jgi:NDP-sugar pyrophosphorylase family protein
MLITAGFGTRLAPLTDLLPKPAVPVGNKPAAFFGLDHLARAGIREIVLNTHHLARELEDSLRAVAPSSVALRFVHEPEILGTGGGVRNAWSVRDGEPFVVMNGKLLFAPDLAAALTQHEAHRAFATMIVKQVPETDATGVVFIDDEQRVRSLPGHQVSSAPGWRRCMYTGVSLLSAAAHAELPERGCLIRDGYARWIERGLVVVAAVEVADFRDIGMSLRHYLDANIALATGELTWPGITRDPQQGLCDPSATFGAGAVAVQSVVGAQAQVAPGARLERCVVWPRARVSGQHADAIVLPDGRVLNAER